MRVLVHGAGLVRKDLVDFEDLARDGQENLRDRLDGLDRAEFLAGVEDLADVGHVDEHDFPELLLRMVADSDRRHVAVDANPLVAP